MDLLLWRHAEARPALGGEHDIERPLTPKGEKQAQRMARWLADELPARALILVSPALRTRQTAQALARPFSVTAELAPAADATALLAAAGWPHAKGTVLLVGHQPALGEAAALALAGVLQPWAIKKGALWWLRSSSSSGGSAADPPAELRLVRPAG